MSQFAVAVRVASFLMATTVAAAADTGAAAPVVRIIVENRDGTLASVTELSVAELEALPQTDVRAVTPWTEGVTTFSGPAFALIAERLAPGATTATIIALNDYRITVDVAVIAAGSGVIALRRDGELMRVRDKGPAWLVFPSADRPELIYAEAVHRWIWQIAEMKFHVEGQQE